MATSGTIWGRFTNTSTSIARPYITWSASQSITNNTSTITAKLYFVRYDGYRSWDNDGRNFTVVIDGYSTTKLQPYDIGPNGQNDLIMTVTRTVNHNDSGTKSLTISASGNTNNSALGSISLSQSITLDTIPRASDFTSFTLDNTWLSVGDSRVMKYTLDRKSSSFTHQMTLKFGSSTIASWTDSGTGNRTRTLTASEVNSIIRRMPSSTTGNMYLTMQTKNGSSNVGGPKTIGEYFGLEAAIKPTASNVTKSISGTGRDSTIGKYIQTISKVAVSFSQSAGYGASISSSSIVVRRASDNKNSQTINGNSGTTPNPVSLSGTYEIVCTVKDSRGRTDTASTTFVVDAYSPPKISRFSTSRTTPSTNVNASIITSWSALGTSNPTDITIEGVDSNGNSVTHYTLNDSTAGSINTNQTYTGQSEAISYQYSITVIDSFGKKATATSSVGTAFQELTIAKGKGVGIGKVHERGSIDVSGDGYFLGKIRIGDYDIITEDSSDGTRRGLELGDGLYIRNGYLEVHSYDVNIYGDGRMQSYYDANNKKYKMFGRDQNYVGHGIDLELSYSGGIVQPYWVWIDNYQNGWENYSGTSGGFMRGFYRKTTHGTVQLVGLVRGGTGPSKIFTLSSGFRPDSTVIVSVPIGTSEGAVARMDISSSGAVTYQTSGKPAYVMMNVEFPLGV